MSETKEPSYREQKIAGFVAEIKRLGEQKAEIEKSLERWNKFTDEDVEEIRKSDKSSKSTSSRKRSSEAVKGTPQPEKVEQWLSSNKGAFCKPAIVTGAMISELDWEATAPALKKNPKIKFISKGRFSTYEAVG